MSRNVLRSARIAAAVLLPLLVGAWLLPKVWPGGATKTATAYFSRTVHLYPGSDVDVLGVKVGTVDSITPVGSQVRVRFSYDGSRRIPANAAAVIIEPTLVADRVIQLVPAYTGGPVLANNAVIPVWRTGVPVELDQFDQNVAALAQALGPQGANRQGALSAVVSVGAANLRGEGAAANAAIKGVAGMMATLGGNRAALFQTIRNLQSFTTALAQHDADTRAVLADLDQVSTFLGSESGNFGTALHQLSGALAQVAYFIAANKHALTTNVASLASVSDILAKDRILVAHMLDMGAVGLTSYPHMYTPAARTYNSRFNGNAMSNNPALFLCQLYGSIGGSPQQCLGYFSGVAPMSVPFSSSGSGDTLNGVLPGRSS